MRDEKKQFVNNEFLNNTSLIINSNTIPSKNNATLVPNRQNINVDEKDDNSGHINNKNNNHSKLFLPHYSLKVYHQNIPGLKHKTNELHSSLHLDLPHIICVTENHLNQLELDNISIENYILGASYCRKHFLKGIFVHKSIKFVSKH
jgi:5-formaminoimidazole-4-carboxamide-1-beta-D-ribofuranosyl 5'-monophosphate synthetase